MEGRRLSLSHLLPAMWAGRPAHPWERELSYCPGHPLSYCPDHPAEPVAGSSRKTTQAGGSAHHGDVPPNPARTEGSEPPGKVPLTHPSSTPRPLPEDGPSRTGTRTVARHVPPCKGAGGSAAVGSISIKRQHWAQLKHFCCVEHRVTHANQRWGGQLHSREGNKEFLLHKLILNTLQPLALGGETPQGSLIPLTDAVFIVVMTTSLPV